MGPKALPDNDVKANKKEEFKVKNSAANPPGHKQAALAQPEMSAGGTEQEAGTNDEAPAGVASPVAGGETAPVVRKGKKGHKVKKEREPGEAVPLTVRVPPEWDTLIENKAKQSGVGKNALLCIYIGACLGVSTVAAEVNTIVDSCKARLIG